MTISSIHFQKAEVEFAKKHNFRTEKKEPEYLLDTQYRKTNEYLDLHDPKELYQEQMELRKQNHCRGYAPQIKDVYWEAVVNLDEKHNLTDVKKVADFIQQKYHIQTCSIALHHDEGYKDKDGTVKYNHHAHICFLTMDNGISTMRKIRSKELRQMQTDVAQLLGLERGKENSKATRLDHKQYREKAKELAEVEQKQKQAEAVLSQVQPVLQTSVNEKKQLHGTVKQLQDEILSLKEQKAIIESERKRWKEAHDFVADEYRKLQALNKSMFTKEQLNAELQKLRNEHEERISLQEGRIEYLEKAYQHALDDNTVLKNDYNELAKDYRKLEKSYNDLNTQYNFIIRSGQKSSEIDENASKYTRVRIDTENQSENILEAYARKLGLNKKSEPEQTDKLHGTEKTTQTTSPLRSTIGFHR